MKKVLLTIFILSAVCWSAARALAFVRYEDKHPQRETEIHMTSYLDYAPFGWVDNPHEVIKGNFHTLFQPLIDDLVKSANLKMKYDMQRETVDELVQKVRQGEIDFMVGAYYQTEMFKGLAILFPAAVYNPITVFMIPNRIKEVKSTEDLKKLKGVRNVNEFFSDFVEKKVEELNLVEAESPYEMFEKLYTRQVDYILTSYYNGMAEAAKLGLTPQIAAAKQTLWNIPMFVGVSKTSKHRDLIEKRIIQWLNDEKNIKRLQDEMQLKIREIQKQYDGVVPPTFGLEKQADSQAVENHQNNIDEN